MAFKSHRALFDKQSNICSRLLGRSCQLLYALRGVQQLNETYYSSNYFFDESALFDVKSTLVLTQYYHVLYLTLQASARISSGIHNSWRFGVNNTTYKSDDCEDLHNL